MKIPSVHLNGSSASTLLQLHRDTIVSIDAALEKLAQAAPHGRDFYVQSPDAYEQARREHDERVRKLMEVRGELLLILENVQNQVDYRGLDKR